MSFGGLVLTGRGREEIAKASSGEALLKIQEVVLGGGLYEGANTDAVSLVNPVMSLPVEKITREGNEIHLEVEFSSKDVPKAFYFREIGVKANDVLCFYDNCGNDAEYLDPESDNIIKQKRMRIILYISSEVQVNVSIASQLYVMETDFLEHKNNNGNPHNVTKEQIGLGRADNTADNEKPVSAAQQELINETYQQLTSYTDARIADLINGAPETLDTLKEIADAMAENQDVVQALDEAIGKKVNANGGDISDTAAEFTEAPSLEEPQSGEMVKTIFGKLKLAVKNLKTLITLIGATDISSIGGGTVTGAISALNSNLSTTKIYATFEHLHFYKCGESFNIGGIIYNRTIVFGIYSMSQYLSTASSEIYIGYVIDSFPAEIMIPFVIPCLLSTQDYSVTQVSSIYIKSNGGVYLSVPSALKSTVFNSIFVNSVYWGYYDR